MKGYVDNPGIHKGGMELVIADIYVQASSANAEIHDLLPAGASGLKVRFHFLDAAWGKLSKTAVFRNKDETFDANIVDDCATIPHEVLSRVMDEVTVGVYGTDSDNGVAVPTVWAKLGKVMSGAAPSGQLSEEATVPYWVQVKEQVDVIQNTMMDQEDLENALIRARDSGDFDGPPGEKGAKGDPGPQGVAGPVGPMPQKGKDYWTAADIAEIKAYVDQAILGGAW